MKLYSATDIGTMVIIADNKSAPNHTVRPGLLFSGKTGTPPSAASFWAPEKARTGPVSIFVGATDRKVYVYRNGMEIGVRPPRDWKQLKYPAPMYTRLIRLSTPTAGATGSPPPPSAENRQT